MKTEKTKSEFHSYEEKEDNRRIAAAQRKKIKFSHRAILIMRKARRGL